MATHQAKTDAIDMIRNLRYDKGEGYLWVNDMGRPIPKISHPPGFQRQRRQGPDQSVHGKSYHGRSHDSLRNPG